jgi:hypothetical protein
MTATFASCGPKVEPTPTPKPDPIVVPTEDYEAVLQGTDYIIFNMGATTSARIQEKIVLDLRPNDQYIKQWDWNSGCYAEATGPDAFGVVGEWTSIGKAGAWSGVGDWIGSMDAYAEFKEEAEGKIDKYAELMENDDQFTLVVIMKCESEEANPWFSVSGFGANSAVANVGQSFQISSAEHNEDDIYTDDGGQKQIHYTNIARDGIWHIYKIKVDKLHGFNKDNFYATKNPGTPEEQYGLDSNIFARGANGDYSCDICAAFMCKLPE